MPPAEEQLEVCCMNSRGYISRLAGVCALAVLAMALGACGSSSPTSAHTSAPAGTSTTIAASATPSSSASANASAPAGSVAAITTNWEAFFNAKTPDGKRVNLLQNGSQFASVIRSQSGSFLARFATAKVKSVTVTSPTQATVKYEIFVDGRPQLSQTGTAILQNGTWKVGVSSFCGLLIIENLGKTKGLPTACQSAA
jgi:hypothetical protein